MNRRFFLKGLLLAPVAPAIVRAESLMPVRAYAFPNYPRIPRYGTRLVEHLTATEIRTMNEEWARRWAELMANPPLVYENSTWRPFVLP